jgi:prevent-host-death family protein
MKVKPMRLRDTVKPISYLKAHTAELIEQVAEDHKAFVITQRGEAKAILQDVASYEEMQESLALLKMLAQSGRSLAEGHTRPAGKVLADLRRLTSESR